MPTSFAACYDAQSEEDERQHDWLYDLTREVNAERPYANVGAGMFDCSITGLSPPPDI